MQAILEIQNETIWMCMALQLHWPKKNTVFFDLISEPAATQSVLWLTLNIHIFSLCTKVA